MANYKSGAERRNDRMNKIFDTAHELAARNAGWQKHENGIDWVSPCGEFIEGSARDACAADNLLGLRSP